jgi:hypothetical protein
VGVPWFVSRGSCGEVVVPWFASWFAWLTPELMTELNTNLDMTWLDDPAVPDLPPMPVTDDPQMNQEAFLWTHFNDNIYPPRVEGVPERRTRIVTENDPLEVDVFWSMRSPYSYLVWRARRTRIRPTQRREIACN